MIYLYGYLAIGAVALVPVLATHFRVKTGAAATEFTSIRDELNATRSLPMRFLDGVVVPFVSATAVIAIWPVLIWMKCRERSFKRSRQSQDLEKVFAVTQDHLLQEMTVQEIETLERVCDPLRAVPDAPFGHLNATWQRFKGQMCLGDSISTFSAEWTTTWGRKELRAGYVILRGDIVGPHFLTKSKILDES